MYVIYSLSYMYTDYLGIYEFVESYESEQGYQMNLIKNTDGEKELPKGVVSERCVVFAKP